MHGKHGLVAVTAATVALAAIGAGSASAATTRTDPATRAAYARLAVDLRALPEGLGGPLLEEAARAYGLVGEQTCGALEATQALRAHARRQLADVPVEAAAGIEADALALEAALLQRADTKACGGGAPAGTTTGAPAVRVLSSTAQGLRLSVRLPAARLAALDGDGRAFVRLLMDGMGERGELGAPALPARTELFAMPEGGEVQAKVVRSRGYTLANVALAPRQDEAADASAEDPFADPPFAFDEKAYATEGAQPSAPAAATPLGGMRDVAVGGLELVGGQYRAHERELRVVTELEVVLTFAGGKGFGRGDAASVWNRSSLERYRELLNWPVARRNLVPVKLRLCGEELLVITSSALRGAADELATSRRGAGFVTRVVEVGSGPGQIGTTAAQIQTYIRSRLGSRCIWRPSYVAIVGDVDQVPTSLIPSPWSSTGFDGMIATDNPYGLANDSDLIPDLAVGRIPARTLAEARDVVAKITGYERFGPLSRAFYRNATITSFFQADSGTTTTPQTQDDRGFTRTSEAISVALEGLGKTVSRVYVADTAIAHPTRYYDGTLMPAALRWPTFAWDGTGQDVIDDWNAGRFLIMHRDHGAPSAWASPDVDTGDVPSLVNGALLPVVLSINCASGMFDAATQSLVEQMVLKASGGAVGAIGDSRNSPTWTNNHMALGLVDAIFPSTLPADGSATAIRRMGDVLVAGKAYMDTQNGLDGQSDATTRAEHSLYHWFGDPTMPIRTSAPLRVAILDGVILRTVRSIVLQPKKRIPRGSWVTVFSGSRPLGRAQVGTGRVVIPTGAVKGALRVAVEAPGGASRSVLVRRTAGRS